MTTNEKENVAQTVKEVMEKYAGASIQDLKRGTSDLVSAIMLPEGKELVSIKPLLDEYLTKPERRTGTAHHLDQDSFIAHVNRFKSEESVVYADPTYDLAVGELPKLTGIINYHERGFGGEPAFGDHRSVYNLTLSDEWKTWIGMNEKTFATQADFAEFIESNIDNVFVYDGANEKIDSMLSLTGGTLATPSKLMELSRGLTINNNEKVTQKINPSTGEVKLNYETEHGGNAVAIPTAFLIAIPPLLNGSVYSIIVRLRYRLVQGQVKWSYSLFRKEKVFEDAFENVCKTVKAGTGLPLFIGSPE